MPHEKPSFPKKIFRQIRWQIAELWLQQHQNVKVIGIAGSVGKTTTKDMLTTLLAEKYAIVFSRENLDPEFNLPLTALKIRNQQLFVAELGIDDFGQMDRYLDLVRPKIGVLTRLTLEHSEFFYSLEKSASEESKLIKFLPSDGFLIANGDDPLIRKTLNEAKAEVITYGFQKENQILISHFVQKINNEEKVSASFDLQGPWGKKKVQFSLLTPHNAFCLTAAITIAWLMGLTWPEIEAGIAKIKPTEKRLNVKRWARGILIDDTYNASPAAVKAAIDLLVELDIEKGTLVLGDMLELGNLSQREHYEVGKYARQHGVKNLLGYGKFAPNLVKGFGGKGLIFQQKDEMVNWVLEKAQGTVLVKGSRGMKMEEVVEKLIQK